jgi:regulator of cell morphogenesis and NO signaling
MSDVIQLDPSLTINEIVARHPETIAVFNRFGMDTCCGGGVSVEEAARRDGLDLDQILAALRGATEQA